MKKESARKWLATGVLALGLLAPGWAAAQVTFDRFVVFGASVSDPGNAFALIKQQNSPPYDDPALLDPFLVPCAPYAVGAHHFSNGATWVEQLAKPLGLNGNVGPAFQSGGAASSNYAVGGARARAGGQSQPCDGSDPGTTSATLNLGLQVDEFLRDYPRGAPSDALYVLDIGGNDVRDALVAPVVGGDPAVIIAEAVAAIDANLRRLHDAGARTFLVLDVPNIGLTPAVRALDVLIPGDVAGSANVLALSFNALLSTSLAAFEQASGDVQIVRLSLYEVIADVVADKARYGLDNVDGACIKPATLSQPSFQCAAPDTYLFWDGIHPTEAGHGIVRQAAERALAQ